MKIFLSPHNDDEVLFGAFTILREQPLVVILSDSVRQAQRGSKVTAAQRRAETLEAMNLFGVEVKFLGIPDVEIPDIGWRDKLAELGTPDHIWAPCWEQGGNVDHNVVAGVVSTMTYPQVTRYTTYTTLGKTRTDKPVLIQPEWIILKLQALSCYKSQILEPSTREHFTRDLLEYYQ